MPSTIQNLFVSLSGYYLNKIGEIKQYDSALVFPGNKEKVDGYKDRISKLLTRCDIEIPETVLVTKGDMKYNKAIIWHEIGNMEMAEKHLNELYEISRKEVTYYLKFGSRKTYYTRSQTKDAMDWMSRCAAAAKEWNLTQLSEKWEKTNKELGPTVQTYVNTE
ncbi:MAG: hypothetical protein R2852_06275 [Bacteroidia bacterium]